MVKEELETRVKEMIEKAAELEKKLAEKERVITERLVGTISMAFLLVMIKAGCFEGFMPIELYTDKGLLAEVVIL
ncbi:hypothetical protein HAX54_048585 [Datura stramonium]|uniref:Uncharacterized protein n=1 Tax=Datura stramonium TaxID=4076 RepID=A0ABS8WN71_DATST|nr:hypothetical protein [Datura stramonium]